MKGEKRNLRARCQGVGSGSRGLWLPDVEGSEKSDGDGKRWVTIGSGGSVPESSSRGKTENLKKQG